MLYTGDMAKEFRDYDQGRVPSHRLVGVAGLRRLGFDVRICRWGWVPPRFRGRQVWKLWQAAWCLVTQRTFDCVVTSTEASALPVLALRHLRLLRRPVVVISVAALGPKFEGSGTATIRRLLLRGADMVTVYASSQVPLMQSRIGLDKKRLRFLPMGVDNDFFTERQSQIRWDVVSVGTNEGKDYPTLLGALSSGQSCLIVTDGINESVIRSIPTYGDVTIRKDVPIDELRDIYASGGRCVIPLRDIDYSSGQTVLLENLAMGRPVVVTDTASVRDYVSAAVATLVPVGDPAALRSAISGNPPLIVPAAAAHTRRQFDATVFAEGLAALCRIAVGSPA